MKTAVTIALLTLLLTSTAFAQDTWLKKPYEEWTPNEVSRALYDSPWAQTSGKGDRSTYHAGIPDYPPETSFVVQVRLYSALPVRQALVRRMQLATPYSGLNATQRADFDAEVDGLLKCLSCAEYYIVLLRSSSQDNRFTLATRGSSVAIDVAALLKRVPEDELLQHVSLSNDKGERRNAARVLFTKRNEVLFLFPRFDAQRNPLITVANKKFYLDFDEFVSDKTERALKRFFFDVKKLSLGNEVVF